MLVTCQTEEEQSQVTLFVKSLPASGVLQPPTVEETSHGSTLKSQLFRCNTFATALKTSTAK